MKALSHQPSLFHPQHLLPCPNFLTMLCTILDAWHCCSPALSRLGYKYQQFSCCRRYALKESKSRTLPSAIRTWSLHPPLLGPLLLHSTPGVLSGLACLARGVFLLFKISPRKQELCGQKCCPASSLCLGVPASLLAEAEAREALEAAFTDLSVCMKCVGGRGHFSLSHSALYHCLCTFLLPSDNHVQFPSPHSVYHRLGLFPPLHSTIVTSLLVLLLKAFHQSSCSGHTSLPHPWHPLALHTHFPLAAFLYPQWCLPAIPVWSLPWQAVTVPFVSPTPMASPPHSPVLPPACVLYSLWPFPPLLSTSITLLTAAHWVTLLQLSRAERALLHFIFFSNAAARSHKTPLSKQKLSKDVWEQRHLFQVHQFNVLTQPEGCCWRRRSRELGLKLVWNPDGALWLAEVVGQDRRRWACKWRSDALSPTRSQRYSQEHEPCPGLSPALGLCNAPLTTIVFSFLLHQSCLKNSISGRLRMNPSVWVEVCREVLTNLLSTR